MYYSKLTVCSNVTKELAKLTSFVISMHGTFLCFICRELISVFGLSNNNKWQRWVQMSDDGSLQARLTAQVSWFGLIVGSRLAFSLHSSNEPSELSHWSCHDEEEERKIFI